MPRVIDVVQVPDQAQNQIVSRVPEHGSGDFRIGSQVVVRESQAAVFFRDGKALDTFGAGRHTITTANIPLLASIVNIFTSGQTPFTAEVYFVNMKDFLDMKWGTPEPISLRDKDLGLARLRAFGSFAMAVQDPQMFVAKIVGTQGLYTTGQIQDYLRGMIMSRLTDLLGETKAGLFDLPALFDEMSAAIRTKVSEDFANLGVQLKAIFIQSISPTEETQKAIDERAAMGAIGDMTKYMQYKAARAMGDAAAAGVRAAVLLQLEQDLARVWGLGAGMASIINQAMQQGMQQRPQEGAAQQAATPEVMNLNEAASYLRVSSADIESLISSGQIKAKKIGSEYRISKKALDEFLAS